MDEKESKEAKTFAGRFVILSAMWHTLTIYLGILSAVLSAFFFSCTDMLSYENSKTTSLVLTIVYMSFSATSLGLLWGAVKRPQIFQQSVSQMCYIILCGFCSNTGQLCVMLAIFTIGPANAIAVYFTMPIFSTLLSYIFLSEDFQKPVLLFMALSISGVFLVTMDYSYLNSDVYTPTLASVLGYVAAGFAAILHAGSLVVRRKLDENIDPILPMLSFLIQYLSLSVIVCTASNQWKIPDSPRVSVTLLLGGVATFLGMFFMLLAASLEQPSVVSIFLALQIFFTYFAQIIFFNFPFRWVSFVGSVFISCSCIGTAAMSFIVKKREEDTIDETSEVDEEKILLKNESTMSNGVKD